MTLVAPALEPEAPAEAAARAGGAVINAVEKQPFIDAMKPVYERFVTDPALKKLVADLSLEKQVLKDIAEGNL